MSLTAFSCSAGALHPLGVSLQDDGINVAVVSTHAKAVFISLYDGSVETHRFRLPDRSGDVHHGFVHGVKAGQRYGLRADGSYDPSAGHLFDIEKLLIDPYAVQLDGTLSWHSELAIQGAPTSNLVPKCIVTSALREATHLPPKPPEFIYEISVKAFTKLHPAIPENIRGTVAALGHPDIVDYLRKLGVDTIELMPLMAWIDERHLPPLGLANAWGYNPISFFAPDPRLAPGGMEEIRQTVAALHGAGIRVVLDVVFNHTGESDFGGPTLSFRGLDSALYYRHEDGALINDTGCGNTLNCEEAPVVQLVMDAMRHWVKFAGIDGFRYDLATVMGRGRGGFHPNAPLLSAIVQDPLLGPLIHIAEPWDIGPGGYRLGEFPAAWHEWNDHFRDDVRRFWRGDAGAQAGLTTRLAGSSDIFAATHRRPSCSINFVAAHDGFTLADAVTHSRKNNFANGEGNRDGSGHEVSWIAADPANDINALLATLFLSRGTPMLTAGDEFGRSQGGNNNAYAQDNETTWLDWARADLTQLLVVQSLVSFRARHRAFFADRFLNGKGTGQKSPPDVEWVSANGTPLADIQWTNAQFDVLGVVLFDPEKERRLLAWFNRGASVATATLPHSRFNWTLADGLLQPGVIVSDGKASVPARTVAVLLETGTPRKRAGLRDEEVERLSESAGIQGEWWEVDGTHHTVTPESKRALLAAMAVPLTSYRDAVEALTEMKTRCGIAGFHLARAGVPSTVRIGEEQDLGSGHEAFELRTERGDLIPLIKPAGVTELQLPSLEPGIHDLSRITGLGGNCRILASTGACYLPPEILAGERCYGLSAHLYALRHQGDAGIGDFETLARYCEIAAQLGGAVAGINPLHQMFTGDRSRVSPYQPSDRRFIDPIYIDISNVPTVTKVTPVQSEMLALHKLSHVDYEAVWRLKERVLGEIFDAFAKFRDTSAFEAFIAEGGVTLEQHAAFEAQGNPSRARYHMWLQWLAERQFADAARRGREAGLLFGIYRDLAVGCAYEGGEVRARPEHFSTAVSLGAPPDPFSRDGQIWNLPPFNPLVLASEGFAPFLSILRANMRHAGVLRIDHILGFARQFWVPRGGTGSDGAYVKMNTDAFIAATAIESHRAKCMVIGEDLGTVPDGLRQQLADASIFSYKMLWFERDGSDYRPAASYPRLSAACLSSHDLAPFAGWRKSAKSEDIDDLGRAINLAGLTTGDLLADAHAFVASSASALMLVQADDLTGETEPLNVPGTDKENPNWRRRLSTATEDIAALQTTQTVMDAVQHARPSQLRNGSPSPGP